ncbi:MAG TPA: Maf family protein [Rhizomicrobium sp.]|nr:Maf family protein [Rhizomicrobium sp.]
MTRLILASGSAARARLLTAAGIAFDVVAPHVDEDAVKDSLLTAKAPPRDIADTLAALKASKISLSHSGALVIGADQALVFDGELISKSPDVPAARALLERLAGRKHELIGAVVLAKDGAVVWRHVARAELTLRHFGETFLDGYLERNGEEILSSVGGYLLEGEGVQLFSHIDGDYFTILGLPMLPLLNALREFGALPA